jgi:hypothetical protein
MTQSPNAAPVLTIPEGEHGGMVAPGQEGLLEEFVAEQEAANAPEPEKLLGKFNSVEDLARSYQELEKRLGQQDNKPSEENPTPVESYSKEQAVEMYGEDRVSALAEKGVDLGQIMHQADNGTDISEHYDALAEAFGVPKEVVENYVNKAAPAPAAEAAAGLSESQIAQLKGLAGGDQGFAELSSWAAGNLKSDQLAVYNQAIDSGNVAAAQMAINWLQNMKQSPNSVIEPKLIGGGQPAETSKFESKQQVLDAMNKRNNRGERLYDVDEAYRDKVASLLATSDVF